MKKKIRSSSVTYIPNWPTRPWDPDVKAEIRTKLGERVNWESMGSHLRMPGKRHGIDVNVLPRYPRAFCCFLENNNPRGDGIAQYDLYDIGVQRARYRVDLYVSGCTDFDIVSVETIAYGGQAPDPTLAIDIVKADYQPGPPGQSGQPNNLQLFRFTGSNCVLRVWRDAVHKKKGKGRLTDDEDLDGAPPPPDPGDDSDELPFIGP